MINLYNNSKENKKVFHEKKLSQTAGKFYDRTLKGTKSEKNFKPNETGFSPQIQFKSHQSNYKFIHI